MSPAAPRRIPACARVVSENRRPLPGREKAPASQLAPALDRLHARAEGHQLPGCVCGKAGASSHSQAGSGERGCSRGALCWEGEGHGRFYHHGQLQLPCLTVPTPCSAPGRGLSRRGLSLVPVTVLPVLSGSLGRGR